MSDRVRGCSEWGSAKYDDSRDLKDFAFPT
jgi:hypothetical protein